ncbi:MAG: PIN domain-containing protein [Chthoniobacterales bacterium]
MSNFFDSSVVIGLIFADCAEHADCLKAWNGCSDRVVYSHALLETFCQLTGGRLGEPVPPDVATESIALNLERTGVRVLPLETEELLEHLGYARRHGVRGGAVYDYMHLCVARKAGADRIFTLNKRHFTAIAPDLARKILHPQEV